MFVSVLLFFFQNWENVILQSLTHLVGDRVTLNVHNDDPAHLVMSLRTLIDFEIQLITSADGELPEKLKRDNSKGAFKIERYSEQYKMRVNYKYI